MNNNDFVEQLHQWIVLDKGGRCSTSEVHEFYEKHPYCSKKGLKKVCASHPSLLTYHFIKGGHSYVEAMKAFFWTDVPCISKDAVKHIIDSTLDVTKNNQMENQLKYFLLQELKKRRSKLTRNELRIDQLRLDELLSSGKALLEISIEENVTTSDMAIALLGWPYIDAEMECPGCQGDERKRKLFDEALLLAQDDKVSGYKLHEGTAALMVRRAGEAEKSLGDVLKFTLSLSDADFITEADVRSNTPEGTPLPPTPDIRFLEPHEIMGKMCYWVECKRSVVVPGVSPDKIVDTIKHQTGRYIKAFGPGMILWDKFGFDQGIVDALSNDILHVAPLRRAREAERLSFAMLDDAFVGEHSHHTEHPTTTCPVRAEGDKRRLKDAPAYQPQFNIRIETVHQNFEHSALKTHSKDRWEPPTNQPFPDAIPTDIAAGDLSLALPHKTVPTVAEMTQRIERVRRISVSRMHPNFAPANHMEPNNLNGNTVRAGPPRPVPTSTPQPMLSNPPVGFLQGVPWPMGMLPYPMPLYTMLRSPGYPFTTYPNSLGMVPVSCMVPSSLIPLPYSLPVYPPPQYFMLPSFIAPSNRPNIMHPYNPMHGSVA